MIALTNVELAEVQTESLEEIQADITVLQGSLTTLQGTVTAQGNTITSLQGHINDILQEPWP
jgi:peptidoglycan hydrolase CwlO-like protein